ncbi:MAG: hemolysin family protein [Hyphomicrobiaceae bacterium]
MTSNGNHGRSDADTPAVGWLAALRARLGLHGSQTLRTTLEEALKDAGDTAAFSAEEREMLLRILRFGALRVDDVMVPRADIVAIDENASVRDLLRLFHDAGVSRIPLFHETLDDLRGMVHVKDVMGWLQAAVLGADMTATDTGGGDLSRSIASTKLRRPVLYVPPSMPAMNLLIRMQTTRNHMALVVDEYGGTDGLVTIEDLVEQIVGDIEDEHDEAEAANITEDPKLGLIAAARTPIDELEERLGVKLLRPEEEADIDTLGGLVFSLVGRVPVRGELIHHPSGVEFEVLDADPRRVKKLKIHRQPAKPGPEARSA